MTLPIRGLSAFPVTPADPDGRVDTEGLQRLLAPLVAAGVDSIGLLGSTGSYPYFTRAERRRAIEAAAECVGGTPLLVGVGALRTDDAVALARDALAVGAAAGLLAPVSYAPLRDDEFHGHVRAVAATGLPICIYNNPGTTHFDVTAELLGRLSDIPGIVAAKNPAPAEGAAAVVADMRARVPGGFSVGFSVDWNAPAALLAGGDAWYSVLGGTFPAAAMRLTRAAQAGDTQEVARLHSGLEPLWQLFRTHTSYRVVHHAAVLAGVPNALPPRPVLPLSGSAAADVERVLSDLGPLLAP